MGESKIRNGNIFEVFHPISKTFFVLQIVILSILADEYDQAQVSHLI